MNLLVCVKFVPDTEEVRTGADHTLVRDARSQKLNPADESALEAALRLAGPEGAVTVLTMGAPFCQTPLGELLARGARRAVLLTDKALAGSDSLATARALAAAAARLGPFDAILCGRRALDGETGQVPPELAAHLDIPCVTNATQVRRAEAHLMCARLLEEEEQTLAVQLPAVVSLCEYAYPLRAPSLAGYRRARQTPVEVLAAGDLGLAPEACGLAGSPTRVRHIAPQTAGRRQVRRLPLDGAAEVLARLVAQAGGKGAGA